MIRIIRPGAVVFLAVLYGAGPVRAQEKTPIWFDVILPASATLDIDGYRTKSTGERRSFHTPPVVPGKTYEYTLKAVDGTKTVTKAIRLKTSGEQVFDLRPDFKSGGPTGGETTGGKKFQPGPAAPGFVTFVDAGRLWVFREGSKDLAEFDKVGEPARHVTRIGVGPMGMTVKAPDGETIDAYLAAIRKPADNPEPIKKQHTPGPAVAGFVTFIEGGRLWVFREKSKELAEFEKVGEPGKYVVRIGAGPMGMTVKAPDAETIDAFLAASKKK